MKRIAVAMLIAVTAASAQIKITAVEKLALPADQEWSNPVFSPDGGAIYFTNTAYDGIWKYSRAENAVSEITLDPGSGNGFTVSANGSQIAYRRTTYDAQTHARTQDAIVVTAATQSKRVVSSGADVAAPAFMQNEVVYTTDGMTHMPVLAKTAAADVQVLGIENTKIAVVKDGGKVLLDPIGGGSYIWPTLSPDRQKIVAYELRRGTFICDLNGTILASLGRRDGAVWTRDGKWLVYMNDRDDGNRITTSDICMVSADGAQQMQLLSTPDVLEMNPSCSPTENKIVCSGNGAIYVLSYEETK